MSWMVFLCFIGSALNTKAEARPPKRPMQMAAYKAHTIMPETFRGVVKRNGKLLFEGLEAGLMVPQSEINEERILLETDRITEMINAQRSFRDVVRQMGYVSGLFAVYSHPALDAPAGVCDGFTYYINRKLSRCLFVFDGYDSWNPEREGLLRDLRHVGERRPQYRRLLVKHYGAVGNNTRFLFAETSPVFGVTSIYFSNVARFSAHLWFYAWSAANGDLSGTPFVLQPPPKPDPQSPPPHLRRDQRH